MKKIGFVVAAVLLLAALYFSYSKRSHCFSPDFARADATFEIGNTPPPLNVEHLLNQSYCFIGSGNQAFAFESDDKTTVLKLFKFHCLQGFDIYDLLPFKGLKDAHLKERQKKIVRLRDGLKIADHHNKVHSGIIYLHFPPSPLFGKKVTVYDRANRKHLLALDQFVFILQKKAKTLGEVLKEHLGQSDVEGASHKLFLFFTMLAEDFKSGLYDNDHNVISNTGFANDEPIRIDFGKLALNKEMQDPSARQKELNKIKDERILPWIKKYYPQFYDSIAKHLENIQKNL